MRFARISNSPTCMMEAGCASNGCLSLAGKAKSQRLDCDLGCTLVHAATVDRVRGCLRVLAGELALTDDVVLFWEGLVLHPALQHLAHTGCIALLRGQMHW